MATKQKPKKKKLKSILKLIKSKPSNALQAMIDGLKTQNKRKDFVIDSSEFGNYHENYIYDKKKKGKVCFGCMATCTVQELAHKNFKGYEIDDETTRAKYLGFKRNELVNFELAIDDARRGFLLDLFTFCELDDIVVSDKVLDLTEDINMTDDNWKEKIPAFKKVIKQLQKEGL